MLVKHHKGGDAGYDIAFCPSSLGVSLGHVILSVFTKGLGKVAHLEG